MYSRRLRCIGSSGAAAGSIAFSILFLLLILSSGSALAGDQEDCQGAGGALLVGKFVSRPTFKHGTFRRGVELSHTHLTLQGDQDGNKYDVAIDNVFAPGYKKNSRSVPAPLNSIEVGDKLSVCGIPFSGGIHFVHNNCGDTPTSTDPNGWVRKMGDDGSFGANLEDGQHYCYLWPRH